MLINTTVMVKWNGYTRKHYEERGYSWTKQNDLFECTIEDVMPTSTVRVEVKCDYCEEGKAYKECRSYLKEREIVPKDCCKNRKCMVKKSEEVSLIKYGVKSYNQTEEKREKNRKLFQTSMSEIKRVSESKGISILNIDSYENDRTRLFVICDNHSDKGVQETNFANIKKNKHCCVYIRPEIVSKSKKLDGEIVYREFLEVGLIPKFKPDDYENNSQPLPFICPEHEDEGVQYRAFGNLKYADGCLKCARERISDSLRLEEQYVFNEMKNRGLFPIDGEKYVTKDTPIKYRCVNHMDFIQSARFGNLHTIKQPCEYCRLENSLSSLNKLLRSCLGDWKLKSEIDCNYKCVLTDSSKYEVHHLYSYNSILKDALNELNIDIKDNYTAKEINLIKDKVIELHEDVLGVCIRKDLHILFHQIYGKKGNTPEQFEEFKQDYISGRYRESMGSEPVLSFV